MKLALLSILLIPLLFLIAPARGFSQARSARHTPPAPAPASAPTVSAHASTPARAPSPIPSHREILHPADTSAASMVALAYAKADNARLQAQLFISQANSRLKSLEDEAQTQERAAQADIDKIKQENSWGSDVTYDRTANGGEGAFIRESREGRESKEVRK